MKDLKNKSVLLFSPQFFGYEIEIKRELEKLGAKVIWFDDRPKNDFFSKAVIRVNKNFLKNKIERYYKDILFNLNGQKVDFVFIVNPEAISKSILEDIKTQFPIAKYLLYMWDSFKNRKQNLELLPLFDQKFTFDSSDAKSFGLKLRPLFYSDVYKSANIKALFKYDLLFVGTAHTDRYHFAQNITKDISADRKKLYFYLSSEMLYYVRRIFFKGFRTVKLKDISFQSLTHSDIANLMAESKAILDINHPKQTGLTMRTFETLGADRKLITTNKEVLLYDFYDPRNILLIERENPVIDPVFLNTGGVTLSGEILFKYSLKGWLMEIFEIL